MLAWKMRLVDICSAGSNAGTRTNKWIEHTPFHAEQYSAWRYTISGCTIASCSVGVRWYNTKCLPSVQAWHWHRINSDCISLNAWMIRATHLIDVYWQNYSKAQSLTICGVITECVDILYVKFIKTMNIIKNMRTNKMLCHNMKARNHGEINACIFSSTSKNQIQFLNAMFLFLNIWGSELNSSYWAIERYWNTCRATENVSECVRCP